MMCAFCKKVLLLAAVFNIMVVCILDTSLVYAVSNSSNKIKVKKINNGTGAKSYSIKEPGVASRGFDLPIGNADINSVVSYAREHLGAKYRYGASGPNSFDCSGFTMYVMSNFGIDLPHSAMGQSLYGAPIPKESLRPGDLVYFDTSGGAGISHVGIYSGENCFIHAALNGVVTSNLDSIYYSSRYVTAKRVIR